MMGRAHALSGMAVGLNTAALVGMPPTSALLMTAVCGGAAVLPDIDHPDSTVSKTLGPATWTLSRVVRAVSGGHRNGTHSALGCAILAWVAFAAHALHAGRLELFMPGLVAGFVLIASALTVWLFVPPHPGTAYKTAWGRASAVTFLAVSAVGVALAAVMFGSIVGTVILGFLLLLVLAALARALRIPGGWDEVAAVVVAVWAVWPQGYRPDEWPAPDLTLAPWALTVGVVVHCAGDAITKGGVPWVWPLSQANMGPQWIGTNGAVERRVLVPLFVLATGGGAALLLANPWAALVVVAALVWLLLESKTRPKSRRKKPVSRARRTPAASRKTPARRKSPTPRKKSPTSRR